MVTDAKNIADKLLVCRARFFWCNIPYFYFTNIWSGVDGFQLRIWPGTRNILLIPRAKEENME